MSNAVTNRHAGGVPKADYPPFKATSNARMDVVSRARYRSRNTQLGLAIVMVLLGGLIAVSLVRAAGHREEVIAIAKPIAAHQPIRADALVVAHVSADSSLRSIRMSDVKNILNKTAAVNLIPGSMLTPEQVSKDPLIPPGNDAVPVLLKAGQFTPNLKAGDHVLVLKTSPPSVSPDGTGNLALGSGVEVYAVTPTSDSTGNSVVTLVLTSDVAQQVAGAASAGQINVALAG